METNQEAAPVLREKLPEHAGHLAAVPELADAWEHELAERQAQAAKVESLLAYKARKLEQNLGQHSFTRRAVEKAVTRDAATALGLTEAAVRRLLSTAEFLTEKLPRTWETYRAGAIDRESAAKVAQAVEDIAHRPDLLAVIDAEIAERAPRENAGAVQKWVPRRAAELDASGYQERYDRAQAKRYVTFRHFGNGMSRIEALIPTLVAAQVEQQIHSQARNATRVLPRTNSVTEGPAAHERPREERTLSQRIADAFIHRLGADASVGPANPATGAAESATNGPCTAESVPGGHVSGVPTNLKIGILVPVQHLTGESEAPAISWDRSWSLPAGTTRQIVLDPDAEHDWYIAGTTTPAGTASASETSQSTTTTETAISFGAPGSAADTDEAATAADAIPEILTVVHPRKGPGNQPLEDWIAGADPEKGNLLNRTYQSRTSRDRQRDAILIRDGQCTQPGCTNPGWQAEIDHTQSFETGGHTTGDNLKTLCRDCHTIKSHRLDTADQHGRGSKSRQTANSPARASPEDEDLPDWLIETRPPPDWAVPDVA